MHGSPITDTTTTPPGSTARLDASSAPISALLAMD